MSVAPVALAAPPSANVVAPKQSFAALLEEKTARAGPARQLGRADSAPLELAKGIEQAQRRLDAVLEVARSGRTFTAQELLALQAQAYRYAQTLDIASKVVEHGAQAVKQAVNTPV